MVRARNGAEEAREGWPLLTTPAHKRIQPDARELLPGGSNETAGAWCPGFFCLEPITAQSPTVACDRAELQKVTHFVTTGFLASRSKQDNDSRYIR